MGIYPLGGSCASTPGASNLGSDYTVVSRFASTDLIFTVSFSLRESRSHNTTTVLTLLLLRVSEDGPHVAFNPRTTTAWSGLLIFFRERGCMCRFCVGPVLFSLTMMRNFALFYPAASLAGALVWYLFLTNKTIVSLFIPTAQ